METRKEKAGMLRLWDDDVEMVRARTDEMMYRNKKERKEECRQ